MPSKLDAMTVGEFFPQLQCHPLSARQVTEIVFDTRKLRSGCVFVAIRGGKHDGHDFLSEAVAAGAVVLVVESSRASDFEALAQKVAIVSVPSSRHELARLADRFFGHPSRLLFTVGVTGTNGKTTSTNMIEAVLNAGGRPTGVIGTIDHHLRGQVWPSAMTTPDPLVFQGRLREFINAGAKAVALEVSSHALDQARVDAVEFDFGIFTNLTRDHLDYHGTMESYFAAKMRFFTELLARSSKPQPTGLFNVDDEWCARGAANQIPGLRIWRMSADEAGSADFRHSILQQSFLGTRFRLHSPAGQHEIHLPMTGPHNVRNAIGAFAAGLQVGMGPSQLVAALESMPGVRGRLERVAYASNFNIFVDYAHSDDSLRAVLALLNSIRQAMPPTQSRARIITIFGCGGDRDRGKRPLMMQAAVAGSDFVILTSDNPRSENPEAILDDAMAGADAALVGKTVLREVDRRKAIALAIGMAQAGDVVLIAGKGHEEYQQIGDVKHPFSDVKVAEDVLKGKS